MHRQFFAHTQHAQKTPNGKYLPWSSKKLKKFPVLESPTQIEFISVKKWVENLTLGTVNGQVCVCSLPQQFPS
jgi:hypothetical protein